MMIELRIRATQVRVGDIVGCSEVDYIVKTVRRVTGGIIPQDIQAQGGWVSLAGDTADGYFARHYDGEEDYYAMPTEMIDVKRPN